MELLGQDSRIPRDWPDKQLPVIVGKEGTAKARLGRGSSGCQGDRSVGMKPYSPWCPAACLPLVFLSGFPRDKAKLSPRQRDAQDTGHLLSQPRRVGSLSCQLGMVCWGTGGGEGTLLSASGWGRAGVDAPSQAGWDGVWSGMRRGEMGWRGRAGAWGNWSPHWSWSKVDGNGGAALASVGLQPVCFRVWARTTFRGVSGRAGATAACPVLGWQSCTQPFPAPRAAGGLSPDSRPQAPWPRWSRGQPHPMGSSARYHRCYRNLGMKNLSTPM